MSLLRSSIVIMLVQVGAAVLLAVNFFVLAANLSPAELGAWSLLLTLPVVVIAIASLGYHKAAMYYVGRRDFPIETVIVNGLAICTSLAVLLWIIMRLGQLFLVPIFPGIPPELILAMVMSTPLQLFLIYFSEASLSANLLKMVAWSKSVPVIFYVGGSLYLVVSKQLTLPALVVVFISGMLITAVTCLGYLVIQSQQRDAFRLDLNVLKGCLRFGVKAQVGEVFQYLSNRVDLLLVGAWVGTAAAGYYSMAVRFAEIIWYVSNSVQLTLAARMAQLGDASNKTELLQRVVRWMLLVSTLTALMTAALAVFGLRVFLPQYLPAMPLLLVLLPGAVAFTVFQVIIASLLGNGQPALATQLRFVLFAVAIVGYVALIPPFGAMGASIGTTISYGLGALLAATVAARLGRFSMKAYITWQAEDASFVRASGQRVLSVLRRHRFGAGQDIS